MELTFFDLTLAENSLLRNKQASTPAAVKNMVATTMGTRAHTRLFCAGCWVVTVGGVSAVSVTFLVSSGRAAEADVDSAMAADVDFAAVVATDVESAATAVTLEDATVGNAELSAAGLAAVAVTAAAAAIVVFCTDGVGRAVGTLFARPNDDLDGCVILPGGGGTFCEGGKIGVGKPADPPTPLIGIDGGMGGLRLGGLLPPPPLPGPSIFAHTCVLDVKCPSWIVTYKYMSLPSCNDNDYC